MEELKRAATSFQVYKNLESMDKWELHSLVNDITFYFDLLKTYGGFNEKTLKILTTLEKKVNTIVGYNSNVNYDIKPIEEANKNEIL